MTVEKIEDSMRKEIVTHDAAKRIREILDEARERFGAEAWDENDCETTVIDLVTSEDE